MKKKLPINKYEKFFQDDDTKDFWGVELLRDSLLPDLLEKDIHDILYWAGKNLAAKYPLKKEDLPTFFEQSQLGNLTLRRDTPKRQIWNLSGPKIDKRIKLNQDPDFMLESGFLAETIQELTGYATEAEYNINFNSTVDITVVSDPAQQVSTPDDYQPIAIHQTNKPTETEKREEKTSSNK